MKDGTIGDNINVNSDLLLNDNDPDGSNTLSIRAVNGKANNVGRTIDAADGGKFTLNANGAWSFDPDGDFDDLKPGGNRSTSVTYTVVDNFGLTNPTAATLTVTVTGVNDAPVCGPMSAPPVKTPPV